MRHILLIAALLAVPAGAAAPVNLPVAKNAAGLLVEATPTLCLNTDNTVCAGSPQEAFYLVKGNASTGPVTLFGGRYAVSQQCGAYGTLKLQRLAADGATWLDTATFTTSDTASDNGITAGSKARVRAVVVGTTGCNATIARVPN